MYILSPSIRALATPSGSKDCDGGRHSKAQQGTARHSKAQQGTARNSKAQPPPPPPPPPAPGLTL